MEKLLDQKGTVGKLEKKLESCEKVPMKSFQYIEITLPDVTLNELSTGQRNLYEICTRISKQKYFIKFVTKGSRKRKPFRVVNDSKGNHIF